MTRPARLVLGLSAVLLAAACKEGKKVPGTPALPEGVQPIAEKARLAPPKASEKCYSSSVRTVFHSKQEWDTYWRGNNATRAPPPPPEGVDWQHEMVAFAAVGMRMSAKDEISIDGAGVRHDTLIVAVRRYIAKDGCGGPRIPTFPQSLVKLPADTLPVHFSEAHVKIPCDEPAGQ